MSGPLFSDADPVVEAALAELQKMKRYPFSDVIDRPYVTDLIRNNPTKDVVQEIRAWAAWMTEFKPRKGRKIHYRARLTNWVERPPFSRTTRREGPSNSPARPTDYGSTSEVLERW